MEPYNPNDSIIANFLSVLSGGEGNSLFEGFGGVDLSGAPQNSYGFPQWGGVLTSGGPTHAAGFFQFEPSTWDSIAGQLGLNFNNIGDQAAGAWAVAQQAFSRNTGGGDLYSALQAGNYGQVQSALKGTWPSVTKDNFGGVASSPLPLTPAAAAKALLQRTALAGSRTTSSAIPEPALSLASNAHRTILGRLVSLVSGHRPRETPPPILSSKSKHGLGAGSKPPKGSVSASVSPSSEPSSSPLVSPLLPSQIAVAEQSHPAHSALVSSPTGAIPTEKEHPAVSEVSKYINSHVTFLNAFLPALKQLVDTLPVPAAAKTAFDEAYALAPLVITTGAAAVSGLQGGAAQPAAAALAGAFTDPSVVAQPAPQPVTVVPLAPPAPAPVAAPAQTAPPVAVAPAPVAQPTTAPAPLVPLATAPAAPAAVADPSNPTVMVTYADLQQMAAKMGLTIQGGPAA